MAAITDIWVEKYRPKTIDEYVFKDENQKEQVEHWLKTKNIPHLLFSGPAGIGKTTLAKILVNGLEIDPYDYLEINASRERGIETIRTTITNFASTMPFGPMKIILLDEADALTIDAQKSLKSTVEEFSASVRFIFTTNHPNKIIPPLHSRCQGTHFEKIDHTEFTARVAAILFNENIEFDVDTLDLFVKTTYPDLRKCLNLAQQHSVTGKLVLPDASTGSSIDYRLEVVKLFKQGKVREARTILCSNITQDDIESIFRWMYDNLDIWSDTVEGQDKAITIIRNGLVNHALVADCEINLSATMVDLGNIGK
jgi:replication factor C small subunit